MSIQLKILVGFIFTLLTCIPLAAIAINDMGRDMGIVPQTELTAMEKRAANLAGREIEFGADIYDQYCFSCHGKRGEGIPQVAPALNRKDLLDGRYEKSIGWAGSVPAFIRQTVAAGRAVQSRPDLYVARMPTWAQEYGGPLRPDQVDAVVAFVLNWKDEAQEINAWGPPGTPLPTRTPGPSPTPAPAKAGLIAQCQNVPANYQGKKPPYQFNDRAVLAAGKQAYDNNCAGCHGNTGKGDGPAAAALNPRPASLADKNFVQGMPVDCHFYRIMEGVAGTGMPPWKSLGEDLIWKILIYERSFSGVQ
jgi:mono/diheme cytochrome c family protein